MPPLLPLNPQRSLPLAQDVGRLLDRRLRHLRHRLLQWPLPSSMRMLRLQKRARSHPPPDMHPLLSPFGLVGAPRYPAVVHRLGLALIILAARVLRPEVPHLRRDPAADLRCCRACHRVSLDEDQMGCLLDQERACIEDRHRQDLRDTVDQDRAGMTGTGIATETGIGIETETFVTGIEIVFEMSETETGTEIAIETETEIVEEIGNPGGGVVLLVEEVVADDTFRKGSLSTTIAWILLPFSSYSYIFGLSECFLF